jgi:prolyl-tRNA synthetase
MILSLYKEFVENELAIAIISGKKSDRERFAGALETYAIEALMSDGKALQMGTSHNLGQHFSKVFNIRFEDREQKLQYAWQTSWGVSTRLVGALIMAHGDDSGLRFPPRVAPIQVIIVPIAVGNWKEDVLPQAQNVEKKLRDAGIRVELDERAEFTPGWKFSEWEMRGVPLRVEIGPRDIKAKQVVLVRRDTGQKESCGIDLLDKKVSDILRDIQDSLLKENLRFQQENTHEVQSYDELKEVIEKKKGFAKTLWCGRQDCEDKIKEETAATIRVISLGKEEKVIPGECVNCQGKAENLVYFARAY